MYHRENDQEDFLVLAGEALAIVEGEERPLRQWDFVHCPAGTNHVLVGAGDGPCIVLAAGARDRSTRPRLGRVHGRRGGAAPRRGRRAGDDGRERGVRPVRRGRPRALPRGLRCPTREPGPGDCPWNTARSDHVSGQTRNMARTDTSRDSPRDTAVTAPGAPSAPRRATRRASARSARGCRRPGSRSARAARPRRRCRRGSPAWIVQTPSASARRTSSLEERLPDAPAARLRRHVDGVLRHAAVALPPRDRRQRRPAEDRVVVPRHQPRRERGARRPTPPTTAPSPRRCRRRAPPRRSGRTPASPPPAARRSSQLERTAHRQPFEEPAVVRDDDEAARRSVSSAVSSSSIASRSRWFVGSSRTRQLTPVAREEREPRPRSLARREARRGADDVLRPERELREQRARLGLEQARGLDEVGEEDARELVAGLVQLAEDDRRPEPPRARRERQIAEQRADQRRLPGAVRADHREAVAPVQLERDAGRA